MNYNSMSADEIVSYIEKFGTESEKVLVAKLTPSFSKCGVCGNEAHCREDEREIERLECKIERAMADLA